MAKKVTTPKIVAKTTTPAAAAPVTTPVRNSAIPPKTVAAPKKAAAPSFDQISLRAYQIHLSGTGGSQDDNWFRAEKELRGA
jgi:hypothetical protein